jgi:hypothetical protein
MYGFSFAPLRLCVKKNARKDAEAQLNLFFH